MSKPRTITIRIEGEIGQSDYANLANALWMTMRSLPYGGVSVERDDQVSNDYLNTAGRVGTSNICIVRQRRPGGG